MNPILEPILTDAVIRFTKFNKPSQADALRILGPSLRAICLDVKEPAERATEWLSQPVENINADSINAFVRSVTEVPAATLEAARLKQAQLERELKPFSERDKVLLERQQPLSERSRQSIEDELYEAHHCRTRDGIELPDLSREQWAALEPRYKALEQ